MSTIKHTQEFINRRKLMTMLPVFVAPTLAILFFLAGGGEGTPAAATADANQSGINMSLPAAGNNALYESKLDAYKAPQDSTRRNNLSFAPAPEADTTPAVDSAATAGINYAVHPGQTQQPFDPNQDPNVAAVQSRMQRLQQQQAAPEPPSSGSSGGGASYAAAQARSVKDDQLDQSLQELDVLRQQYEQRLTALNTPGGAASPAVAPKPAPVKKGVSVVTAETPSVVSRLNNGNVARSTKRKAAKGPETNSFHSIGEPTRPSATGMNAVPAVVHSDQVVSQGSTVKLRLLSDVEIQGQLIPRNSFIYGTCGISGNRLTIKAANVQYENNVFPISLKAFDLDGNEGLNIPGSVERDAAKQGLASGTSSAELLAMSPNLATQAAGVALQTGKALTGKKIRQVKIHLKANYQLLLK
ncbi:conjugative transposon protein TraM [Hymenobacter tenuis]